MPSLGAMHNQKRDAEQQRSRAAEKGEELGNARPVKIGKRRLLVHRCIVVQEVQAFGEGCCLLDTPTFLPSRYPLSGATLADRLGHVSTCIPIAIPSATSVGQRLPLIIATTREKYPTPSQQAQKMMFPVL